jgi:hypothetical protein
VIGGQLIQDLRGLNRLIFFSDLVLWFTYCSMGLLESLYVWQVDGTVAV